jgi:two-component system response regulator AtoC
MLESQLFGHRRGAFTGADRDNPGVIRGARGGTLFLDEIGELSLELQPKLLRFLESGEVCPLGETTPFTVNVRIVAATNVDLKQAVSQGTFREDLFYRLNVMPIQVPPLRERREDVPLLVDHFVHRYSREFNKDVQGISREALSAVQEYPWPGNVRELQNVIERLVGLVDGPLIGLNDLPLDLLLPDHRTKVREAEALPLKKASDEFERQIVLRVLERVNGNRSEAARILGVHRNSLKTMLERWKIRYPRD